MPKFFLFLIMFSLQFGLAPSYGMELDEIFTEGQQFRRKQVKSPLYLQWSKGSAKSLKKNSSGFQIHSFKTKAKIGFVSTQLNKIRESVDLDLSSVSIDDPTLNSEIFRTLTGVFKASKNKLPPEIKYLCCGCSLNTKETIDAAQENGFKRKIAIPSCSQIHLEKELPVQEHVLSQNSKDKKVIPSQMKKSDVKKTTVPKTYKTVKDLPAGHRIPWPFRTTNSRNNIPIEKPCQNYNRDLENAKNLKIRETWDPLKLPAEALIIHGLEPNWMNQLLHFYHDFPECPTPTNHSTVVGEGIKALSHEDVVRYYPHLLLNYKQIISGSLICLNNDPKKTINSTYSACGFVLDVPSSCLVAATFEDFYSPHDMNGGVSNACSYDLYDCGSRTVHQCLATYSEGAHKLQSTPSQVLAYSYLNTPEDSSCIPQYNEVLFLPSCNGNKIKIKGVFINVADHNEGLDSKDYEDTKQYRDLLRSLAHSLQLKIYEFESGKISMKIGEDVLSEKQDFHYSGYKPQGERMIYRNPLYCMDPVFWEPLQRCPGGMNDMMTPECGMM